MPAGREGVCLEIVTQTVEAAKELAADISDNDVDHDLEITFTRE